MSVWTVFEMRNIESAVLMFAKISSWRHGHQVGVVTWFVMSQVTWQTDHVYHKTPLAVTTSTLSIQTWIFFFWFLYLLNLQWSQVFKAAEFFICRIRVCERQLHSSLATTKISQLLAEGGLATRGTAVSRTAVVRTAPRSSLGCSVSKMAGCRILPWTFLASPAKWFEI